MIFRSRTRWLPVFAVGVLFASVFTLEPAPPSYGSNSAALTRAVVVGAAGAASGGGWTVTSTGQVASNAGATNYGGASGVALVDPIVGMAATPDGGGYWLVASDGGCSPSGTPSSMGRPDP